MEDKKFLNRIGLGTVQWGMSYGVANTSGVPEHAEVNRIAARAWSAGIDTLDTSPAYGTSESVIGGLTVLYPDMKIVTKTRYLREFGDVRADVLVASFDQSLRRMGVKSCYGLIIHNLDDIWGDGGPELVKALSAFKDSGRVRKIGFSAYSPESALRAADIFVPDMVQMPLNILDQRIIHSGLLRQFWDEGIEVHTRSCFLQGLLLMPEDQIPFNDAKEPVLKLREFLVKNGMSPIGTAVGFCMSANAHGKTVLGFEREEQLTEAMETAEDIDPEILYRFACDNEKVIDPRMWG